MTQVVQPLTFMTPSQKTATWKRIESLRDESSTNLWAGIRTGLDLFSKTPVVDNIQGLYVLTDGMPNHLCPKQGYVTKLRPMLETMAKKRASVPTIHTFGFGYQIRSELMQSIAEVGKGTYSFIPDAGMIGTVFVHAVANLFTTVGTSATLELRPSKSTALNAPAGMTFGVGPRGLLLNLGNIQYGQSRDLLVECPGITADTVVTATLNYKVCNGFSRGFQAHALFSEKTNLPQAMVDYHSYRAEICRFLAALFPLKDNGEHSTLMDKAALGQARDFLNGLARQIQTSPTIHSLEGKSLLEDLVGEEPAGQISKALIWSDQQNYWQKWGRHYLPSLLHAHQRQMCNTFKDPGPLLYGKDSPLFKQCRDELDAAFDNLPAPKPSRPPRVVYTYSPTGRVTGSKTMAHRSVKMRSYNSCSAPCFEGNSKITIASGSPIPIKTLKPGMFVWTPMGRRKVAAVLKTRVRDHSQQLCRVGELLVTPWHPIKYQDQWVFPSQVSRGTIPFHGDVYSVLLLPFQHPDGHAIEVGGHVAVTLGHGVVGRKGDVRSHPFFGNYRRVVTSLSRLQADRNGHLGCGGMRRDARTGLACGFVRRGAMVKKGPKTMGAGRKMRCLA